MHENISSARTSISFEGRKTSRASDDLCCEEPGQTFLDSLEAIAPGYGIVHVDVPALADAVGAVGGLVFLAGFHGRV